MIRANIRRSRIAAGVKILKEQYFGDLTIFDPETISDQADFSDPRRFPEGIQCVIVNGCVAWQEGGIPKAGQGKLIRRRQSNL